MSTSAICSEPAARPPRPDVPHPRRRGWGAPILGFALTALLLAPGGAVAQEVLSQQEALRLAFPGATTLERRTAFLDEAAAAAVRRMAGRGVEVKPGVVSYYVGMRGAQPLGVAYFDVHRVRTLPEVLMIVVTPQATIERIEILKFSEPPDYRAPRRWLEQFEGKRLDPELSLRGEVVNLTGATLTSRAVTEAARRVLALHRAIDPFASSPAAPGR